MSELNKQSKSIFELLDGQEVKEPAIQLENGSVVRIFKALQDIYLDLQNIEGTDSVLYDIDLLGTLLLSDTSDVAKDRLITWQANMLTAQLEREMKNAI